MAFSSANSAANPTQGDLKGDVEVANPPTDSVSALRFSPTADYLSVSSWDNNVRIYEVKENGTTEGKAMFSHEGPALSTCWSPVRELARESYSRTDS
jgi:mRNA export factor